VARYVIYRGELQNGSMNGRQMTRYATIDVRGDVMAFIDGDVDEGQQYRYRVAVGQRRRGGQEVHLGRHLSRVTLSRGPRIPAASRMPWAVRWYRWLEARWAAPWLTLPTMPSASGRPGRAGASRQGLDSGAVTRRFSQGKLETGSRAAPFLSHSCSKGDHVGFLSFPESSVSVVMPSPSAFITMITSV